jgi:hypothetical protein
MPRGSQYIRHLRAGRIEEKNNFLTRKIPLDFKVYKEMTKKRPVPEVLFCGGRWSGGDHVVISFGGGGGGAGRVFRRRAITRIRCGPAGEEEPVALRRRRPSVLFK